MIRRMISSLLQVSVILGLASVAGAEIAKPKMFNIKSYGAVGDGEAMETEAIQKTIDACHAAGGGMVLVPPGDFVTGTLHLKSHITLSLDYGASLLGSQNQEDYPTDKLRRAREGQSECLLYAEDATNIRGVVLLVLAAQQFGPVIQ